MVEMAESPRALGVQEEKDLKKFLKFLSLKVIKTPLEASPQNSQNPSFYLSNHKNIQNCLKSSFCSLSSVVHK